MKTKVWLTRHYKGYDLWVSKPSNYVFGCFKRGRRVITLHTETPKKYFGLKKHLKPSSGEVLEGTMEFKFKEK